MGRTSVNSIEDSIGETLTSLTKGNFPNLWNARCLYRFCNELSFGTLLVSADVSQESHARPDFNVIVGDCVCGAPSDC